MSKSKVLVLQADTRHVDFKLQSRALIYPDSDHEKIILARNDPPRSKKKYWKSDSDIYHKQNHELKTRIELANSGSAFPLWSYWELSSLINRMQCQKLHWRYHLCQSEPAADRFRTWIKVTAILEQLLKAPEQIIVFIDSDAWIRDTEAFSEMIEEFVNSKNIFLFGRDPPVHLNTRINTGCILMKNNDEVLKFWKLVWDLPNNRSHLAKYLQDSFHEQSIVDILIEEGYSEVVQIAPIGLINSPCGTIVRHCWWKEQCYEMMAEEAFSLLAIQLKPESPT